MAGQRDGSGGGSTTEAIRREAAGTADTTKEQMGRVTEEAQRQGRRLLDEAGSRLRDEADGQASRAAGSMRNISSEIRSMANASEEPEGTVPRLMRDGADQLESFAARLDAEGWDALRSRLESLARRQPAMFLAGAFGAGMLAGRIFRNADTDEVRRHIGEDSEAISSSRSSDMEGASTTTRTTPGTARDPLTTDSRERVGTVESRQAGSS